MSFAAQLSKRIPRNTRRSAAGKHGAKPRKLHSYKVFLGNKLVGHAQQCYGESWRKSGRIRTGFRGYYYWWSVDAYRENQCVFGPTSILSTRKDARNWIAETLGTG